MGGYRSPGRRLDDPDSEGDASDMAILNFADCALTLNCACALVYTPPDNLPARGPLLSAGIVTWEWHTHSGGNGQIILIISPVAIYFSVVIR